MGWMNAIALDVDELVETVQENAGKDPGLGELHEALTEKGWVSPTVAGLSRRLISDVMGRTPQSDEDAKQLQRVIALLGTGE